MTLQIPDRVHMAQPQRRGTLGLIVGVVVVLAALWVGYWFVAREVAAAVVNRAASGAIAGRHVVCVDPELAGFPLRLDVRCVRATYADAGGGMTAALGSLSASAPLYRPGHVSATLTGPLTVNVPAPGIALTASWSDADATASAWLDGLTGGSASFISLDVENGGDAVRFPLESLKADTASAAAAPAGSGDYRLSGTAKRIQLATANHGALPDIDGDASVTLVGFGSSLGTDPVERLRDWLRKGDATAKIDHLRLAIAGAVFVADGSLTVSADGLLNGTVLLGYNSIDALANLIETLRPGTSDRYQMPLQVLNALSKPVTIDGETFHQTPLTFTDSVVWVGIAPLPDRLPPLKF